MAGVRMVLVITSIIVHVPENAEEDFTFVEPFDDRLRDAIAFAFADVPEVEFPGVSTLDPIWIEGANLGRCSRCGGRVTDYTAPDQLPGIAGGRLIAGTWLCDECENSPVAE